MPKIKLLLHNIRSTYNVGSILRTAEGFGVKDIIISGYTPYPTVDNDSRLPHIRDKIHNQISKTALGAQDILNISQYDDINEWLNSNDLPIIALEQSDRSVNLRDFAPPEEFVLLLGEEVNGIEEQYLRLCESIVEIPMFGHKESFNVSVATGIALYQLSV